MEEKDEEYKVPEYPNQEKGFFFDEQKFAKFSKDLFNFPIFAVICGIYLNIIYILSWKRKTGLISMVVKFFIHYLIIQIILKKIFKIDEIR